MWIESRGNNHSDFKCAWVDTSDFNAGDLVVNDFWNVRLSRVRHLGVFEILALRRFKNGEIGSAGYDPDWFWWFSDLKKLKFGSHFEFLEIFSLQRCKMRK